MAKNKKNKKKTKPDSTVLSSDITSISTTTANNNSDYYYGTKTYFRLPNGDTYTGDFCAHRAGLIWREGFGVYTTHDGHIYEGEWKEDRLLENKPVQIQFPNGAKYSGKLLKGKYSGGGVYTLPNGFLVSSNFNENKPLKDTIVIDVLDKLWCGYTKNNTDFTYLLPENEFYLNINNDHGKGVLKVKPPKTKPTEDHTAITTEEEDDEKIIFAKSTKTRNSLDFEDSLWYKRYKTFKDKHDSIKQKIREFGKNAIETDEMNWWTKYQKYKARQKQRPIKKQETAEIKKYPEIRCAVVFYPEKQPEADAFEVKQKIEDENERRHSIKTLYENLKNEKEEIEARIRKKILQQIN